MRIITLLLLFVLSFNSCGLIIKSYIRKDAENVPPDFGKEKMTLLVLEHRRAYNRKVEKIVNKFYTGPYTFVSFDDLKTKTYRDTVKYRFLLNDNVTINQSEIGTRVPAGYHAGKLTTQNVSSGSRSFRIIDREEERTYDTGVSSGVSWKKVLKAYLKKLEAERIKNGGM